MADVFGPRASSVRPFAAGLPAQVKIVALVGFLLAVVATPAQLVWPYFAQLSLLAALVAVIGLPPARLLPGLTIEAPFLLFALLLPFVATGPRVEVLGLPVSASGLWGAWTLVAKGTLGILAAGVLAATTSPTQLLDGLRRLRLPAQLGEIMGLMIRYLAVVVDQWQRMTAARAARGFVAAGPREWLQLGRGAGTLFIRAYERGERVHLAMLSRGYAGALPAAASLPAKARPRDWLVGALLPSAALAITLVARTVS